MDGISDKYLVPFETARPKLIEIIGRCSDNADSKKPVPSRGYCIGATNTAAPSPDRVRFDINAGGTSQSGPGFRAARLWTGFEYLPNPALTTYPIFKSALLAIVDAWDSDYAVATTSALDGYLTEPAPFHPAWMTYLSAKLASHIEVPHDVMAEKTEDGGILMSATQETFDAKNPKHMEAAKRIQQVVAPLRALTDVSF